MKSCGKFRPDSALISRRIVRRAMRARPELRYKDASKMLRPLEGYISRRNEESLRRQLSDLVTDRRRVSGDSRATGKRFVLRWIGAVAASLAGLAVLGTVWWFLALSGLVPSFLGRWLRRRYQSGSESSAGEHGTAEGLP